MAKKYIILLLFIIITYINTIGNYGFIINLTWNIGLPNADKNIYHTDSGPSFLGDGIRYSILKYNAKWKLKKIKQLCIYSKNTQIEKQIQELLEELDYNQEYELDFTKDYLYYTYTDKKDERCIIYILYFEEKQLVYVIENLL